MIFDSHKKTSSLHFLPHCTGCAGARQAFSIFGIFHPYDRANKSTPSCFYIIQGILGFLFCEQNRLNQPIQLGESTFSITVEFWTFLYRALYQDIKICIYKNEKWLPLSINFFPNRKKRSCTIIHLVRDWEKSHAQIHRPTLIQTVHWLPVCNFCWSSLRIRSTYWLLTLMYSHCWALPRPKYQIRQRTSGQTAPITGVTSGPQLRAPAQPVVGGEKAWRGRQTLNVISVHVLATIGSNQRKRLLGKAQGQANWTPVRILFLS